MGSEGAVRRGALLVAAVLLLAACAQVPTAGPVVEARPVSAQDPAPYVGVVPPDPRPGDSASGVVEGFLTAMASYVPGYPVARRYLTPEAAASWQPSSGVTVVDGASGPSLQPVGPGVVRLSYALAGAVAADGSYAKAAPGTRFDYDVTLAEVGGHWRVANPPAGVLVTAFDFAREFHAYDRFFYDPTFTVLVPDAVYLPVRSSVSTVLVESLLRGPSQWLAPAVVTAVPAGTALAVRSVPVDQGTALVDLDRAAAVASAPDRERMADQIAWTLGQVPEISRVELSIGGLPLDPTESSAAAVPVDSAAARDPSSGRGQRRLVAVSEGRVVTLGANGPVAVDGALGEGGMPVRSVAMDLGAAAITAVRADGTALLLQRRSTDEALEVLTGADLASPVIDRAGRTWVVDRSGAGPIRVVDRAGTVAAVSAPGLDGHRLVVAVPAPDGARVAVLADDATGRRRLMVGIVLRDEGAVGVDGLRELPVGLAGIRDVAWADGSLLAVLPVGADGVGTPSLVDLSGVEVEARGRVPGAVDIAAAAGQPLVVSDAQGRLQRQDSLRRWRDQGMASAPAYVG